MRREEITELYHKLPPNQIIKILNFTEDLYFNFDNSILSIETLKEEKSKHELCKKVFNINRNMTSVEPYELSFYELEYILDYYQIGFKDMNFNEQRKFIESILYCLERDEFHYLFNSNYNSDFDLINDKYLKSLNIYFKNMRFNNTKLKSDVTSPDKVFTINNIFWFFWEIISDLLLWDKYKKVYIVTKELEQDLLYSKDIVFPKSALSYIPFKIFYLDISNNNISKYELSIKGALIKIVEYNGNYMIDAHIFRRNRYIYDKYQIFNIRIEIIDDEYICDSKHLKEKYSKIRYNDCPLNILKQIRDLERFILSTIFYMCCINKRSNKIKYIKNEISINNSSQNVNKEELGFNINDLMIKSEINNTEEIRISNIGKNNRKLPKPHLVRGHFHSYWVGSKSNQKERKIIHKYIEPYFTGLKQYAENVNITNLH